MKRDFNVGFLQMITHGNTRILLLDYYQYYDLHFYASALATGLFLTIYFKQEFLFILEDER